MSTTAMVSYTTGDYPYWYPGYYPNFTPVPTYIPVQVPTTYIQLVPPHDKIDDLIKAINRLAEATEKQNGMAKG